MTRCVLVPAARIARRPGIAAALLVTLLFASMASDADAMGLGAATVTSGLGEPLRLTFPVSTRGDEEVGCVQVRSKDDMPSVANVRTAVIRNAFQSRVEIRSAQPVYEPAIGLVVSVGCTSPISREYVVFLDPPVIAPTVAADDSTGAVPPPARAATRAAPVRRTAPVRAARRANPSTTAGATTPRAARLPSAGRRADPSSRPPPPTVAPSASPRSTPAGSDRLMIVPTEPRPAPGPVAVPPPTATPAAPSASVASPTVAAPIVAAPTVAAPQAAPAASASSPPVASPAGDVTAREQELNRQQADLQQQVKALGDQIAAMKAQTMTLVTRNQALEESSFAPWLIWLLIALAAIAIGVAAWVTLRYGQLRRSIEGAAWWTASTGQAPAGRDAPIADETRDGLVALDAGTRLAPRPTTQTDLRASPPPVAAPPVVSNVERSRPVAPRNARYPAAIDTDFTVSDIEAAMATVRTVSPPQSARPKPLEDTDFAALGGPTLPSPFTEPPPAARTGKAAGRDGGDPGQFVDLDIPPLPVPAGRAGSPGAATAPTMGGPRAAPPAPAADDETSSLDFKLDIPHAFDPLATDSLKTTVVDRPELAAPVDFELPSAPTPVDFDLAFSTTSLALPVDPDLAGHDSGSRHGATALDDLFASQTGPGVDTILDLDDRHGTPLTTTEIDRLTTTAIEGPDGELVHASTRARLARFADLMNQVDEVSSTDPLRAIAQLRQHVLRDEKIPTLLWLKLFELYKHVDKQPVYEALADHFARRYQRPMIAWDQQLSDRVPQTPLSAMNRIDREIEASWGKEEGLERIRSLLCDREQDDAIVFNAVLQRDLLDAAKVFPPAEDSGAGPGRA